MNTVLRKQLAKKNGKKGFTLVEVVVVILIIAILAAISIPALTGYIDKAREKQLLADGHTIQVAMQTIITEAYANNKTVFEASPGIPEFTGSDVQAALDGSTFYEEIEKLTGTNYDFDSGNYDVIQDIVVENGVLIKFDYGPDGFFNYDPIPRYLHYEKGKFTITQNG
jgi:prepilin-type N-terminal cleavage/methylation domain-containing protein